MSVVDAVSCPEVQSELRHAFPNSPTVTHVAALDAVKATLNALPRLCISNPFEPILNGARAVFEDKSFESEELSIGGALFFIGRFAL